MLSWGLVNGAMAASGEIGGHAFDAMQSRMKEWENDNYEACS